MVCPLAPKVRWQPAEVVSLSVNALYELRGQRNRDRTDPRSHKTIARNGRPSIICSNRIVNTTQRLTDESVVPNRRNDPWKTYPLLVTKMPTPNIIPSCWTRLVDRPR